MKIAVNLNCITNLKTSLDRSSTFFPTKAANLNFYLNVMSNIRTFPTSTFASLILLSETLDPTLKWLRWTIHQYSSFIPQNSSSQFSCSKRNIFALFTNKTFHLNLLKISEPQENDSVRFGYEIILNSCLKLFCLICWLEFGRMPEFICFVCRSRRSSKGCSVVKKDSKFNDPFVAT